MGKVTASKKELSGLKTAQDAIHEIELTINILARQLNEHNDAGALIWQEMIKKYKLPKNIYSIDMKTGEFHFLDGTIYEMKEQQPEEEKKDKNSPVKS
jgi:hypothetical protein